MSPAPQEQRRGRHRMTPDQRRAAAAAAARRDPAWVSRRSAMALFGGAALGAVIELGTDRTPAAEPVSMSAPAPTASATPASARPSAPAAAPTATPTPAPTPVPQAVPAPAAAALAGGFAGQPALEAALTALPHGTYVAYGVGVLDGKTGRRFTWDTGAPFEMASTVKVDIVAATMVRAREAGRGLTSRERSLATSTIRNSDSTAAQTLFKLVGDRAGMQGFYDRMGMTSTRSSTFWGLTTTTPADRLLLLEAIDSGKALVSDEDGEELLELMRSVQAGQRWGVGAVAHDGERAAVKNGWQPLSAESGRWIISTHGQVAGAANLVHLAVCSKGHASQSKGIAFVEQVLRLAREQLQV